MRAREFLVGLIAILFFSLASTAMAQPTVQRFELGKPVKESGTYVCVKADVAVALAKSLATDDVTQAMAALAAAKEACGNLPPATYVYKRQIFRVDEPDGTPIAVYEATVEGFTVYVPMRGFLAGSDS